MGPMRGSLEPPRRRYTHLMPAAPDQALVERFRTIAGIITDLDLLVLFGSRAAGTPRSESDVDLAALVRDPSPARRRAVEVQLARAAGVDTDVIFLDAAPPQLRFEIARGGVVVFEREPGRWARERARAMVDWWDWAPVARRIHASGVARARAGAAKW
jgi:predicted nucleotidyltransferase